MMIEETGTILAGALQQQIVLIMSLKYHGRQITLKSTTQNVIYFDLSLTDAESKTTVRRSSALMGQKYKSHMFFL